MSKPRILLYDIETSPNLAYVWGKYQQDVVAFKKERELLSFAYKWLGESKITCITRQYRKGDLDLCGRLTKLLNTADIVIFHNGLSFDRKVFRTRCIANHIVPHRTAPAIDTLKVAREYFGFNGNSLDDLARYLGIGRKLPHKGIEMWLGCMADNPKDWDNMARYNKHDIYLLEELYKRFLPWIENHPNLARLLQPDNKELAICPVCTSKAVQRRGLRATMALVKQQWQCTDCGKWFLTKRIK